MMNGKHLPAFRKFKSSSPRALLRLEKGQKHSYGKKLIFTKQQTKIKDGTQPLHCFQAKQRFPIAQRKRFTAHDFATAYEMSAVNACQTLQRKQQKENNIYTSRKREVKMLQKIEVMKQSGCITKKYFVNRPRSSLSALRNEEYYSRSRIPTFGYESHYGLEFQQKKEKSNLHCKIIKCLKFPFPIVKSQSGRNKCKQNLRTLMEMTEQISEIKEKHEESLQSLMMIDF